MPTWTRERSAGAPSCSPSPLLSPTAGTPDGDKHTNTQPVRVIAPPPLVYLAFLAAGIALHFLWAPLPIFPESWLGHAAGWPIFALASLIAIWVVRTFSRAGEDVRIEKPTKALVSSGPFRLSRNPMYGGLSLLYLSISLILNAAWPLVFLPGALLLMHFGVIKREEAYLEVLFGRDYRQYRDRVRRWL